MSIDCSDINIISEEEKPFPHSTERKQPQDVNNDIWLSSGDYSDSSTSSSTQSWVDEAETGITKELQEQYDKFEAALYAETETTDLPKYLQEEVKIWSEHSPHIRVRGKKANLNIRTDDIEEETYNSSYEEVIESHGTLEECLDKTITFNDDIKEVMKQCPPVEKEIIKEDLKNAIVDKLFDHAWPKVLAKFEPVIKSMSAGKKKRISQSFQKPELYLESVKNQKNVGRSNSSRSYMREMLSKKPFVNTMTQHHSLLSSRGLRKYCNPCDQLESTLEGPVSPRSQKCRFTTKSSRTATTGPKTDQSFYSKNSSTKKPPIREPDKHIILPPIEALAIAPMAPDQRSSSAMVKFTKTLPRVRPNIRNKETSKSASSHATEINQSSGKGSFSKRINDTFLGSDLQVVGTRSATTVKNNKYHQ